MKNPIIEVEEDKLLVTLKKEFYEKKAVFAAAYKFTDKCSIKIEPIDEYYVGIYFTPLKDHDDIDAGLNKIAKAFCNEALDQQIR